MIPLNMCKRVSASTLITWAKSLTLPWPLLRLNRLCKVDMAMCCPLLTPLQKLKMASVAPVLWSLPVGAD